MKYKKLFLSLLSILLIVLTCLYSAYYINPYDIKIREETIKSDKLANSFDDFIIAYFADIHYGRHTTKDDLEKIATYINSVDPDVVIFGGDLIDNFEDYDFKDEDSNNLIEFLSSINSKYGKYLVNGNHDLYTSYVSEKTSYILTTGGFVPLTNTSIKIYTNNVDFINIVGIDSLSLGNPQIETAYQNVDSSAFTLCVSHCPDIFDSIDFNKTDYMLSAHSHGLQIYIPLFNYFYRNYGAKKYIRGKYNKNNVTMDITNGIGTTYEKVRFLADSEIVFYKLKSNS